ncbi:MAG: SRPBCC domain-containing protein [Chloroflexota bacterium]|nr:SRPBCC domain-containing protein [Dehalococcoidia bacterium]MDW8254425.1 SRPBCC domain-containing protein [Chloroflexota bacterium]
MKFEYAVRVSLPAAQVTAFVFDVPAVAACVPGVERVEAEGGGVYRGVMKVVIGPVALTLTGHVREEVRDAATGTVRLRAEAADRRVGGSVRATLLLSIVALHDDETEVRIVSEAYLLGKLGEFGQPLIRKKADQVFSAFSETLRQRLSSAPQSSGLDLLAAQ